MGLATQAQASVLIDNGTYLTDPASGLDWLKLTQTLGQSYNTVAGQMDPGETYAGWRFATAVEFNSLVEHYTGGDPNFDPNTTGHFLWPNVDLDGLVKSIGVTSSFTVYPIAEASLGLLGDSSSPSGYHFVGRILDIETQDATWTDRTNPYYTTLEPDGAGLVGAFLVRSVPEPTTLALFGLGLAGLGAVRRKKLAH
jgi:hypothetical protein